MVRWYSWHSFYGCIPDGRCFRTGDASADGYPKVAQYPCRGRRGSLVLALSSWFAIVRAVLVCCAVQTLVTEAPIPGISALLSLCTPGRASLVPTPAELPARGIAWLRGTIREAGHGNEHRGAKVPMPTSWRHANMWALFGCSASRHGVWAFCELADRYPCVHRPYLILDTQEPVTYLLSKHTT